MSLNKQQSSSDLALEPIQTSCTPERVVETLSALSKKGKLPGFQKSEKESLACVAAHGTPFDSTLTINYEDSKLTLKSSINPMMPTVFIVLLIVSIWPGLPLADGFLSSFEWYSTLLARIGIDTWHWYLPITIIPSPFAIRTSLKKSRISAHASAQEIRELIQSVV